MIKDYSSITLDFDGVLVDSNKVFEELLLESYPNITCDNSKYEWTDRYPTLSDNEYSRLMYTFNVLSSRFRINTEWQRFVFRLIANGVTVTVLTARTGIGFESAKSVVSNTFDNLVNTISSINKVEYTKDNFVDLHVDDTARVVNKFKSSKVVLFDEFHPIGLLQLDNINCIRVSSLEELEQLIFN